MNKELEHDPTPTDAELEILALRANWLAMFDELPPEIERALALFDEYILERSAQ